jgi:hypothetical protein
MAGRRRRGLGVVVAMAAMVFLSPAANAAKWIERCVPKQADYKQGEKALSQLNKRVTKLAADGSTTAVRREFQALLKMRCFTMAPLESDRIPKFQNALVLKTWWASGGLNWLRSYLDMATDYVRRYDKYQKVDGIVFPPDERIALTLETAPKHRLAPLLCGAADSQCGRQTAGWRQRADEALANQARVDELEHHRFDPDASQAGVVEQCGVEAARYEANESYIRWYECVGSNRPKRTALPLGHFKAPTDGWLVLRTYHNHAHCKEIRAYDLATGSAYTANNCGLSAAGRANQPSRHRTKSKLPIRTEVGRLSLENLREAAWMILMDTVRQEDVQVQDYWAELPAHISPRFHGLRGFGSSGHGRGCIWTRWEWMWVRKGGIIAKGLLDRGGLFPVGQYAAKLLEIAQRGIKTGCPNVRLPKDLPLVEVGGSVTSLKQSMAAKLRTDCKSREKQP